MQQFEAMCSRYSLLLGHARDVAFRTVEACDKANRDRIAADAEDDWNCPGRRFRGQGCRRGIRNGDYGYPTLDQIVEHCRYPIIMAF